MSTEKSDVGEMKTPIIAKKCEELGIPVNVVRIEPPMADRIPQRSPEDRAEAVFQINVYRRIAGHPLFDDLNDAQINVHQALIVRYAPFGQDPWKGNQQWREDNYWQMMGLARWISARLKAGDTLASLTARTACPMGHGGVAAVFYHLSRSEQNQIFEEAARQEPIHALIESIRIAIQKYDESDDHIPHGDPSDCVRCNAAKAINYKTPARSKSRG